MYITVGEIIKAQGIRGEVKVKPLTGDVTRYRKLKAVYISGIPYQILSMRIDGAFVYLSLSGVADRNAAEALRGKTLDIDRVNAVEPEEGAYFIADVVGCAVVAGGEELGNVTDVDQYGAADVFTVSCADGRIMRFPFLKKLNVFVDIEAKTLTLDKAELDKVAVYED